MNNKSMDDEDVTIQSTYELVTLERVFASMHVHLTPNQLKIVSQAADSPYHQILQVPLKNIYNGIIIGQANDYREYAQKMLIDYLLSGSASSAPGQAEPQGVKLELEQMKTALIDSAEKFDLLQFEHYKLVNETQKTTIATAENFPEPKVLIDESIAMQVKDIMSSFLQQAEDMNQKIMSFRQQFYETILKIKERLDTVSDYFNKFKTQPEHLEAINFNVRFGDDTTQ